VKFLKEKPTKFYPTRDQQKDFAPVDPRRWTSLSNYIISNTEKGIASTIDDYGYLLDMVGTNFIGEIYTEFKRFVMEGRMLTLADVLSGKRKADYARIPRENRAEVINELKAETQNPLEYTKKEVENLKDFLLFMREADHDILAAYIYDAGHLASAKIGEKEQGKTALTKDQLLKIPYIGMVWGNFEKELDYVYNNRANKTEPEPTKK